MAITLQLAIDTGASGSDRVTSNAALGGTGATPNGQVAIRNGGTLLGSAVANGSGTFSFVPSSLANGSYSLTATDSTNMPATVTFRLDTTAPTIPLVRLSDVGNVNLPIDPATGADVINAAVRGSRFDLNVVTSGVEGGIGLTATFGLAGTGITIPRPVNVFPNNPVGDGIATISARATNAFGAAFQSVPDGLYALSINVADQAGNPAAQATRNILIDTTADAGNDAGLAVDATADGVVNAREARSVAFTVAGLDADVLTATARFTGSGGSRDVALTGGNGTYSIDLSGFEGSVASSLLITDIHANTATVAGIGIQIDPTADGTPAATLGVSGTADSVINAAEAGSVAFTVAGLDADASASATFTDGTLTRSAAVAANGSFAVDLSGFDGPVTSSLGITDAAGNTAGVRGNAVVADTRAPAVVSTSYGANDGTLRAGETVTFALGFSEVITVAGSGASLTLNDGGTATYVSGSGSATLTFAHTVQSGQNSGDLAVTGLILGNAVLRDGAGNDAVLAGAAANPAGLLAVDTVAPTATIAPMGPLTTAANVVGFEVALSEGVTGLDAGDFRLATAGAIAGARILGLTPLDATHARVDVAMGSGNGSLNLTLVASGSSIADAAGNLLAVDAAAPSVAKIDNADGQPLVDDLFYLSRNPDVAASGRDADAHYAEFGFREGRDPNAFFSTTGYLAANPDVRAAGLNPLTHYEGFGFREGRDPGAAFDTQGYLARNADVRAANVNPLAHYLEFGQAEGRAINAAIGRSSEIGSARGFDAEFYLLSNPDVARAAITAGGDGFAFARDHFTNFGAREGRDANAIFDTDAYLARYTDVAAAGVNPLTHYTQFGFREGRDPSAGFDSSAYLAAYSDVRAAGIDPMTHYLQFGLYEGRLTFGDGTLGAGTVG
ncbi:beta strand repeat-containing protein [Methylobacterium iners]|uniref:Bacterial Ig-like domain-containing protein n=1 Tax=Methylobacterium iners TaxID=418707 RepID=A0ABQ4RU61_9HYPH|nr:Ig-like domain-containing protein [Methylobacterium iners]GJD94343.1 hypothetical protein OCOJLMKI_1545 [Methylobacterium iners]